MLLSPRSSSMLFKLLRLAAAWLAVVLLLQGLAATNARVGGPRHTHASPMAMFEHGHHHDEAERHFHTAADASVIPDAEALALQEALDAAAVALAMAFALLVTALALRWSGQPGRFWRSATAWSPLTTIVQPLLKPPRGG